MEENPVVPQGNEQQSSSVAPQPPLVPQPKPKNTLLRILVRLLYLVVILVVGTGGYYLGFRHSNNLVAVLRHTIFTPTPTISPTPTITPTPAPQTVNAGGLSSFSSYTLTVPGDWKVTKQRQEALQSDKTIITRGNYVLTIIEGPLDGGACGYADIPLDSMGDTYGSFVVVQGSQGRIYRRAMQDSSIPLPPGANHYDVCEFQENYNMFMQLTTFGVISYTTPTTPDDKTLQEMDAMLASLHSQQ